MEDNTRDFNSIYRNVLDNLDSYIYISDYETDELIYVNKNLRDYVNIPEDYRGKKCFELFKYESNRCIDCPKNGISRNQIGEKFEWEDRDSMLGNYLQNKGNVINCEDGRLVFMRQFSNITDYKIAEKQAKTRLLRQELMSAISKSFISSTDINLSIDNALKMAAEFMDYDKALLAIISDDCTTLDITNEYQGENMKNYMPEWISKQLEVGDIIYDHLIIGKETYLELHGKQCEYFPSCYSSGLRTSLIFPIKFDDDFLGIVKFDMLDILYEWEEDDIQLAGLIASIFAGVIKRLHMSKNLNLMNAVVQHTEQVIAYFNKEGTFEFFNDALCKISGYSREELELGGHYLLYDEVVIRYFQEDILIDIQDNNSLQMELPLICKDKSIEILSHSFFSVNEGIGMVASNITEAKRMQKEFDITKQRLEIAVKSSGIGIWDVDMNEYNISFDAEFANIYGISKKMKSPTSLDEWFKYLEEIEIENGSEELCDFIKSGGLNNFNGAIDIIHKDKDGLMVFSRAYSTPIYDEDGNLDHIIGMTWNITEDVEKNLKMKEIQDRLSIALEASNAGVWEIDFKDNTISFDSVFAKINNIKYASPMNLKTYCKYLINTVSPEHVDYIEVLKRGLQGLRDVSERTYKHIFDNDEVKYLSNTIRVIKNNQEETERVIGMVMDVTELRLAELDIEERLEQQQMMADIAQRFVKIEDIHNAFVDALEMIASFLKVNSAYIYRYNQEYDIFELAHNWTGNDVYLDNVNVEVMNGNFIRKYILQSNYNISAAEEIRIPSVEMNSNSGEDIQISHLNVPLYIKDKLWGFVGVSNIMKPRYWNESDKNMLYLFSGLVDTAIGREIAEENLKMSERTLQAVFNVLHIAIFWKDTETGIFEGCNEAFLKMVGKNRKEVIGKTNIEVYSNKEFAQDYNEKDGQAIQKDEPFFYYNEMEMNGKLHIVKVSKSVIRDSKGNPIRLVGTAEDITESRNMENRIQEGLENQELAMNNFNGLLMSIGNDRIIKLFGGTSMFGVDGKSAVGKNYNDVYKDVPVMRESLEKAFMEGSCEFLVQREKSTRQCQLTTIYDSQGEQKGILFVGKDITELYDTQKKLEKAIIEAEEASRAKSDFLARMSHEIRTPMNAIIGMTRIGMDSDEDDRKQYCLNRIDVASANLLDIINQILDMSKIEANKLELDNVEFNLKKVVNSVCMVMGIKLDEKSQNLSVIYEGEFNNIFIGDETRISQVITNLLSNSIKFTPEQGNIQIRIEEVEDIDNNSILKISISDNGIGISEEQRERIFHSFEQADGSTSRRFGGTGLGLAICKRIVEMMDGEIWVESELDKGATFIFTIQLKKGKLISEKEIMEANTERNATLFSKDILLVEDVDINREIVITLLMELGMKADIAINGRQAVEIFKENPEKYDLILMDIQMPEMDGYEATRCIRALPYEYASKIGIVAMTANVFKEDIEKCLEAGMNEHISKPINLHDMQEKMIKYIR